jgi:ornithine cyclodeaminase
LQTSIPKITIINRSEKRANELAERLPGEWTRDTNVVLLNDSFHVADALSSADCIVTSTNSATPIFDGTTLLKPGCHINGIGSYTPEMQEVAARTVDRCRIFMDTPEAKSVGDLRHLNDNHPIYLLGELLLDPSMKESWKDEDTPSPMIDCTFYKSVGTCIQDVMTASLVVQRARELGIGTEVDMS